MQLPRHNRTPWARALPLGASLAVALALTALAAAPASGAVPRTFFGASAVTPDTDDYAGMKNLGLGTVRVEISWRGVQTTRGGGFNWAGPDKKYENAAEQGLRPLPMIFGTPTFIESDPSKLVPPVRTKANRDEWRRFVATAMLRYAPGGAFWRQRPTLNASLAGGDLILWNEQNARSFWHPRVSPGEYATLLRMTSQALAPVEAKLGHRIRVHTGGMYGFPRHKKSMSAAKFLRALYGKRRARAAIEGVTVHPYASNTTGVKRQTRKARGIMNRARDRRARLLIGEVGWASGGPEGNFLVKDPQRQAELLDKTTRLFVRKRGKWKLTASLWYVWRDHNQNPTCVWCPHAGLVDKGHSPKPSYRAYRDLIDDKT